MKFTRNIVMFIFIASFLLVSGGLLNAEEKWVNLLPENQLGTFWKTTGNWSINDQGVVKLQPREGETGWKRYDAYLWLTGEYKNFEFEFEYQLEPQGNSGFYFHVADQADPVTKGIEVQIYDSFEKPKLTDHTSGGVIPGIPPTKNLAKQAGEWNHFRIRVFEQTLTVSLNGEVVNIVQLDEGKLATRPKTGSIGFQDHGLPLMLRKLKVRKL